MIDAEIRGKIRSNTHIEQQEDILTSNVFGLMRIIPDHLIKILANAKYIKDNNKFLEIETSSIVLDSFELWKSFTTEGIRDEPDIYFELNNGQKIIVEVKYHSGESNKKKSSENKEIETNDEKEISQLAKYVKHCDYLIYLTFFNEHQSQAREKYNENEKIYLMTWREFHQSLKEEMKRTISSVSLSVLQLIDKYLNHKNTIWDSWSNNFTVNISKGSFYE